MTDHYVTAVAVTDLVLAVACRCGWSFLGYMDHGESRRWAAWHRHLEGSVR